MSLLDFLKREKRLALEELANIPVEKCMRKEIVALLPEETLEAAISKMESEGVNFLVIAEGDRLKGVLTDGDVLSAIYKRKALPAEIKVSEVMSTNLLTIKPGDTILKALEVMVENKIRRLPVAENDKLLGLISLTDIGKLSGYDLTFSIL